MARVLLLVLCSLPLPAMAVLHCAAGRYWDAGLCSDCPAGQFTGARDARESCAGCPLGKYQDRRGAVFCAGCPAGKRSARRGATCAACDPGRWSARGAVGCAPCPAGRWGRAAGEAHATCGGACPAGKYSLGGTVDCSNECAPGRYGRGGDVGARCSGTCHIGRYGAGGSRDADCTGPCPAGRFGARPGLVSAACDGPCARGRWGRAGADSPLCAGACPLGRAALGGAAACHACTSGRYQPQRAQSRCLRCAAGRFSEWSAQGSASCAQCPAGSFAAPGAQFCSGTRAPSPNPTPSPTPPTARPTPVPLPTPPPATAAPSAAPTPAPTPWTPSVDITAVAALNHEVHATLRLHGVRWAAAPGVPAPPAAERAALAHAVHHAVLVALPRALAVRSFQITLSLPRPVDLALLHAGHEGSEVGVQVALSSGTAAPVHRLMAALRGAAVLRRIASALSQALRPQLRRRGVGAVRALVTRAPTPAPTRHPTAAPTPHPTPPPTPPTPPLFDQDAQKQQDDGCITLGGKTFCTGPAGGTAQALTPTPAPVASTARTHSSGTQPGRGVAAVPSPPGTSRAPRPTPLSAQRLREQRQWKQWQRKQQLKQQQQQHHHHHQQRQQQDGQTVPVPAQKSAARHMTLSADAWLWLALSGLVVVPMAITSCVFAKGCGVAAAPGDDCEMRAALGTGSAAKEQQSGELAAGDWQNGQDSALGVMETSIGTGQPGCAYAYGTSSMPRHLIDARRRAIAGPAGAAPSEHEYEHEEF